MSEVFILPVDPDVAFQEFETSLDGVLFRFRFRLNARDAAWYMDLFDGATGALLRAGVKVVTGWDLLRLCKIGGRPAGHVVTVTRGSDNAVEARALGELGRAVVVTYVGES